MIDATVMGLYSPSCLESHDLGTSAVVPSQNADSGPSHNSHKFIRVARSVKQHALSIKRSTRSRPGALSFNPLDAFLTSATVSGPTACQLDWHIGFGLHEFSFDAVHQRFQKVNLFTHWNRGSIILPIPTQYGLCTALPTLLISTLQSLVLFPSLPPARTTVFLRLCRRPRLAAFPATQFTGSRLSQQLSETSSSFNSSFCQTFSSTFPQTFWNAHVNKQLLGFGEHVCFICL